MAGALPVELLDQINDYIHAATVPFSLTSVPTDRLAQHPALTPPTNGRCMINELPKELMSKILCHLLRNKDVTIHPVCQQHAHKPDPQRIPRRNTVSDMMLISKRFEAVVTTCVYSERFFAIHVHAGVCDGGVEFLDTGRQPLHYKSTISDTRFVRFDDGNFCFHLLKKLEIIIHPSKEDGRHSAMTTYYINHALVRMLERNRNGERIVSLIIKFARSAHDTAKKSSRARDQTPDDVHPWWNHEMSQPRATSIHGISDVELALHPFTMLTTVHDVRIYLPTKVKNHDASARFAQNLQRSMQSNTVVGTHGPNDELERHAEIIRDEIETIIFNNKHGSKGDAIPMITDQECVGGDPTMRWR